jgi:hypothetical protein
MLVFYTIAFVQSHGILLTELGLLSLNIQLANLFFHFLIAGTKEIAERVQVMGKTHLH